mmetsp:Transcript_21865/g.60756  ORF Transcript_21865/g.60756 Transcript_21865/m.60756 type:complete len:158 (-) Transcript_21865:1638-2111(-)
MSRPQEKQRKANKNTPSSTGSSKKRKRWGSKVVMPGGTFGSAKSSSASTDFSSSSSGKNKNKNNNADVAKSRNNQHHREQLREGSIPATASVVVATTRAPGKGSGTKASSTPSSNGIKDKKSDGNPGTQNRWLHLFFGQPDFRNGCGFSLEEFEFEQ